MKGTSRYWGVYWHNAAGKWAAHVSAGGRFRHLGVFEREEAAGAAVAAFCDTWHKLSGETLGPARRSAPSTFPRRPRVAAPHNPPKRPPNMPPLAPAVTSSSPEHLAAIAYGQQAGEREAMICAGQRPESLRAPTLAIQDAQTQHTTRQTDFGNDDEKSIRATLDELKEQMIRTMRIIDQLDANVPRA